MDRPTPAPGDQLQSTGVMLPARQIVWLDAHAAEQMIRRSDVIRHAIEAYMRRKAPRVREQP